MASESEHKEALQNKIDELHAEIQNLDVQIADMRERGVPDRRVARVLRMRDNISFALAYRKEQLDDFDHHDFH